MAKSKNKTKTKRKSTKGGSRRSDAAEGKRLLKIVVMVTLVLMILLYFLFNANM